MARRCNWVDNGDRTRSCTVCGDIDFDTEELDDEPVVESSPGAFMEAATDRQDEEAE